MNTLSVLDAVGRRRAPATLPGYHAGPTRGPVWAAAAVVRSEFRRLAARAGVRHRFAPHRLRHATPARASRSTSSSASSLTPTSARPRSICRDRPRRDHHGGAHAPRADGVRQRRTATLSDRSVGAPRRSRFHHERGSDSAGHS
jgi:hypothetical protein